MDWDRVLRRTGRGDLVLTVAAHGLTGHSGERLGELRLDAVRLAAPDVIDAPDAWEWLRLLLATGTCALALGLGEQVLRMTSAYTAKREQFGASDGVRRVVQTARHLHGGLGDLLAAHPLG